MLASLARKAASTLPAEWLVSKLERLDVGRADLLPVLTYHRVLDAARHPDIYPGHCVHPAHFETQMRTLARRYEVVPLDAVLSARRGEHRLPRRVVLVTFDDAYQDFAEAAWPILRSLDLPATVFVPTGFPDQPDRWFWWDRLYGLLAAADPQQRLSTPLGQFQLRDARDRLRAFRQLRILGKQDEPSGAALIDELVRQIGPGTTPNRTLGWDDLRRLHAEGLAVAPHSRTHRTLTALDDGELDEELRGSLRDVAREIGIAPPCFAYPGGIHDRRVVDATERAGYEAAFTTRRGVNDLRRRDWLRLRRVNVGQLTGPTLLRAQVGSWAALVP
jgi:peptidoglycan/xylan/chitin deacetylase (PgdA/CDA1 family)